MHRCQVDYRGSVPRVFVLQDTCHRLLTDKKITNVRASRLAGQLFPITDKPQKVTLEGATEISSPNGMRALLQRMARYQESFRSLNLKGLSLSSEVWSVFVLNLQHCIKLGELELNGCSLTLSQFQELGLALSPLKSSMIHLAISNNPVTSCNWQFLQNFLNDNTSLCRLDVSDNDLGDQGLKSLLEVVSNVDNFLELVLDGNGITDCGAKFLCEWIRKEKKCKPLFVALNKNQITNEGLEEIVKILRDFDLTISIVNNHIDAKGIEKAEWWLGNLDQLAFDQPFVTRPVIELYAGLDKSVKLLNRLTGKVPS